MTLMRWPQRVQPQRVDLVDLGDQPGPSRGAALARLLRVRDRLVGRRRLGGASGAVGVLAVEERSVLPRVGDVVAQASQPLERVHRLEVPAE
jgi:hypothetical protein